MSEVIGRWRASAGSVSGHDHGLALILNSVLVSVMYAAVMGVFSSAVAAKGGQADLTPWLRAFVPLGLALLGAMLLGRWLLTRPEPGETLRGAGRWVRWAAGIHAGNAVLGTAIGLRAGPVVALVLVCLSVLAWCVLYSAEMEVVRVLGRKAADPLIERRARVYRWLLPVLHGPGIVLLGLGPVIAMTLHWRVLDRLRRSLAQASTGSRA